MNPVVLIPYREAGEHRKRNFDHVVSWWQQFGWRIIVSPGPEGDFNRSAARNQAAAAAGFWEVAVFADADTIGEPDLVRAAVRAAASGPLTYPYTKYRGLSASDTLALVEGRPLERNRVKRISNSPGGILAISHDLYSEVGGWDEQFEGWGYEDLAFMYAAGTLGGLHREDGTITHLWHPVAEEKPRAIARRTPNRDRKDRYQEANGNPDAMRRLLEELR